MKLGELEGTQWSGTNELWLDPSGDEADKSEATLQIEASKLSYTWSQEGTQHGGSITWNEDRAAFQDTFHASTPMALEHVAGSWALLDVEGTYPAPEGPPWGWRIYLSLRPGDEELVLQMLNITPWGEDGRAVRMICKRA